MRTRLSYCLFTLAIAATTACSGAPRQRPIKGGAVDTGPQTLTAARTFLEGRWILESFEVRQAGKPPIVLKGAGTLLYDNMGNLKMDIQADEASADLLRQSGIDIRDNRISTDGRAALDLQKHTLTYVLQGQAPLIKGPLGMERPRHWVVEGDTLILTTQDDAGQPLSIGRWKRSS
ncbi:MAG TPA: hypothetical protein VFT39_20950 [Vicinamibacterales bacterium]|nr:hypothetical protein [Vicinamibacterales bacterium]